jgi:hypothetical protein
MVYRKRHTFALPALVAAQAKSPGWYGALYPAGSLLQLVLEAFAFL